MHQDWLPGESQGNSRLRPSAQHRARAAYDEHRGGGRHRAGPGRRRWIVLPVAILAATLAGGVAMAGTRDSGARSDATAPVTLQSLSVNTATATAGQAVTARATLVAKREWNLSEVAIAVTAPGGQRVDFAHSYRFKVGTSPTQFSGTRSFDRVGTYTYWFAYKKFGRWTDLTPKQTFTVGAGSPTPSPSASTSPTPSPSASSPQPSPTATATATASPTPTASATSSPNPSLHGCATDPGRCGYPTPATTGVPAGTTLRSFSGDFYARTAGQVIENMEINGCLYVHAPGVTIRNTRVKVADRCFYGVSTFNAGGTTTLDRTEIVCNYAHGSGLAGTGIKASRLYLHECENGLEMQANSSIVDSVIQASERGNTAAHGDGIQSQTGTNIVASHNTLLQRTGEVTSAIITNPVNSKGWVVENNFMGGGAYTLYCPEEGTNFVVRNNRFVPAKLSLYSAQYGLTNGCNHAGITWSGNFRDTDGGAVPK